MNTPPLHQLTVAWLHVYRKKGGGRRYTLAEVGDASDPEWKHPEPDEGFEWISREPLVVPADLVAALPRDSHGVCPECKSPPAAPCYDWCPKLKLALSAKADALAARRYRTLRASLPSITGRKVKTTTQIPMLTDIINPRRVFTAEGLDKALDDVYRVHSIGIGEDPQ